MDDLAPLTRTMLITRAVVKLVLAIACATRGHRFEKREFGGIAVNSLCIRCNMLEPLPKEES